MLNHAHSWYAAEMELNNVVFELIVRLWLIGSDLQAMTFQRERCAVTNLLFGDDNCLSSTFHVLISLFFNLGRD